MLARVTSDKEEEEVGDILIGGLGISGWGYLNEVFSLSQNEPPTCTLGGISHMAWGLRQSGFFFATLATRPAMSGRRRRRCHCARNPE